MAKDFVLFCRWGLWCFLPPLHVLSIGAVQSSGHFVLVYLIAMIAVSFTALSYGKMASALPEDGSTYAYASKAIHPAVGYLRDG